MAGDTCGSWFVINWISKKWMNGNHSRSFILFYLFVHYLVFMLFCLVLYSEDADIPPVCAVVCCHGSFHLDNRPESTKWKVRNWTFRCNDKTKVLFFYNLNSLRHLMEMWNRCVHNKILWVAYRTSPPYLVLN